MLRVSRFRTRLTPIVLAATLAVGVASFHANALVGGIESGATASERADRLGPPEPQLPDRPVPPGAEPVDTSNPDRIVGTGSPASCTSSAVVAAVAAGGIITFDCGPDPVTIQMDATAKVVNTSPVVVLDGGGTVTLSGQDQRRIVYMNTCDRDQVWTTPHCNNQDHPQLTIQNMTFTRGNGIGQPVDDGGGGGGPGGAVYVRGGQVRVLNSTFTSNRCDPTGPDVGGAALRVLSQFDGRPVIVSNSVFGGSPGAGNVCSNGAGISSIGVSWQISNTLFSYNRAIGNGANPAQDGTPGGGSGGAIYLDGNEFTLSLDGVIIADNTANEGGSAIFFVSNNRTGELRIANSTLQRNTGDRFGTPGFPGIFYLGNGAPQVSNSTIE